jgi:hypothetical protein
VSNYDPPIWNQNLTYPAQIDRQLIAAAFPHPGVLDGAFLKVSQRAAGANMSVDVAAGRAVVAGGDTANQGSYLAHVLNPVNVPIAAAPGAGLVRVDLVHCKVNDAAVTGTLNTVTVETPIAGSAVASNPAPPATPNTSIPLAWVTVAAGTASITNAMIADKRTFARAPAVQAGRANYPYTTGGTTVLFPNWFSTTCYSVVFHLSLANTMHNSIVATVNNTGFVFQAWTASGEFGAGTNVFVDWVAVGD